MKKNNQDIAKEITRKEAIKTIGSYSKYAALTALGTFMILNPLKAKAASDIGTPGSGGGF